MRHRRRARDETPGLASSFAALVAVRAAADVFCRPLRRVTSSTSRIHRAVDGMWKGAVPKDGAGAWPPKTAGSAAARVLKGGNDIHAADAAGDFGVSEVSFS